ncbi:MAG TPA: MlaD family protein [Bdellovibrionota bacterium]|nr:MlaD family protein [Bdellovibrionota bacterium]
MKRLLSTEFTVGAFALLGLAVIIYMSLQINDRGTVGGAAKRYHAYFESVSGLFKRVPVEVSGIPAGFVDDIVLENNRARVTIRVKDNVNVYENSVLSIRDRGLLGDRFLALNPGTPDHPLLPEGGEIPKTYSRSDIDQLTSALSDTATMIQELIKSDNPQGALGKVVLNLRDMTGKLNDIVGDNQGRLDHIVKNLDSFSTDLSDITGENKDQIHTVLVALQDVAEGMREALGKDGNITKATEKFDHTMEALDRIVAKIDRGEGTVGKLLNDDTTVNNLNDTLENVNDTLGTFKRVTLGVRYRGEYLLSSDSLQNLVGISIAPSPDKYILFEIVDAPQGKTRVVNTTVTQGGTVVSNTQTVQTNDDILFTFLLAKRFWNATFRFGLIRSEGGIGFDYHLFRDKFIVSFEAFDFGRINDRAHLRAYGTLVLYKYLLLTGGVDDMATKNQGKNGFFGAGIQFTDNDLKALVSAVPLGKF